MKLTYDKSEESNRGQEMDKRTYAPRFKLEYACPKCGAEHERDYTHNNYLSYPPANEWEGLDLYCGECGHEWEAGEIRVNLSLSVRGTDGVEIPVEMAEPQ